MKMTEVQKKAKDLNIKPGRTKKADLIRQIQQEEGNTPCFQGGNDSCDQKDCCWGEDCQ